MTQDQALDILKTGANVFLTGEPGSGKTYTVNAYVRWLTEHAIQPAITASTGIAATHVGGRTIHSWTGLGVRPYLSEYDLDQLSQNKRLVKQITAANVLIIDEVSMLSATTLDMAEAVCRAVRRDERPFGGLQVILVGDFFQLPPVQSSGANQPAAFAFTSRAWSALDLLVCYLSEQHRQDDGDFLDFLAAMRRGEVGESHKVLLRRRYSPQAEDGLTQLYSHNADVDAINDSELKKLDGGPTIFEMTSHGRAKLVETLKRGCLSPERLALKLGAKVMFTKNDILNHRFVNGTLGTIVEFAKEGGFPVVETKSGRRINAEPLEWNIQDGGKVLASIAQVPLRLAWAITVHKSQGMSLDAAHMDLSQTFEYGQGYVALSRVRSLAGLSLAGLNPRALEVHPAIRLKDVDLKTQSAQAERAFQDLAPDRLQTMQHNFIKACGGSLAVRSIDERQRVGKRVLKPKTHQVTRELLARGLSLSEISKERGLALETILNHLEELVKKEEIEPLRDLIHLIRGQEKTMAEINQAFRQLGHTPLKPVFDQLDGRIPYATIRLARLLFIKDK